MNKRNRLILIAISISIIVILLSSACSSKPSGTFTATGLLGIKSTVTFNGDILELQTPLGGKDVFKYEIRSNGTEIILTNIATNKSQISNFKYVNDPPCVVLNGTAYYK
jgi:hypothetical protein